MPDRDKSRNAFERDQLGANARRIAQAVIEDARRDGRLPLGDREAKYRTLFETMTEGFGICELIRDEAGRAIDWRFLELNPALTSIQGWTWPFPSARY